MSHVILTALRKDLKLCIRQSGIPHVLTIKEYEKLSELHSKSIKKT